MKRMLADTSLDLVRRGMRALRNHPTVRRLYYSRANAEIFADPLWHDVMLADRVRVDAYARAIEKYVRPGHVVVDLGTGLGVLACLAARRGAKVYAVEHSPLIHEARRVAEHNGLSNIEYVNVHSRDFRPSEKVDFIIHEQIGNVLVDEDMVANVVELRDRVLAPGGRVLPARFELYVDAVTMHDERRLPFHFEQRFHGIDFGCLERDTSGPRKGNLLLPINPEDVQRRVTRAQRVLSIDLDSMREGDLRTHVAYETEVESDGRIDGFCVYFEVRFDDEIAFRTGPDDPRTHWLPRLLRTRPTEVRAGDVVRFEMDLSRVTDAARWTWSWTCSPARHATTETRERTRAPQEIEIRVPVRPRPISDGAEALLASSTIAGELDERARPAGIDLDGPKL